MELPRASPSNRELTRTYTGFGVRLSIFVIQTQFGHATVGPIRTEYRRANQNWLPSGQSKLTNVGPIRIDYRRANQNWLPSDQSELIGSVKITRFLRPCWKMSDSPDCEVESNNPGYEVESNSPGYEVESDNSGYEVDWQPCIRGWLTGLTGNCRHGRRETSKTMTIMSTTREDI